MDPNDQESLGEMAKTGLALYRALIRDGAEPTEAYMVLAAMFTGMFGGVMIGGVKSD